MLRIKGKLRALSSRAKQYMKMAYGLRLIRLSGFFDETWYLDHNPDVARAKVDPLLHYLLYGGFEGRNPGPNFCSDWYLKTYEDVRKSRINPLLHYLKLGWDEGRFRQPENSTILLTVIIFAYNHEDSIAEALDSVLNQVTKYRYEIWVCEDCSTDGTLEICNNYAKRYPEKIKIFAQSENTHSNPRKVSHFLTAKMMVNSKYYCILDGDDAWCDEKKIQIAIDFLEDNPAYITFAHDTVYNDIIGKTKKSLVHDVLQVKINNPVIFESAPYLHTSSRIYRNIVRWSKKSKPYGDIYTYYTYLDKGPLYYYDKIMSVYNITGKGVWSQLSEGEAGKKWIITQGKLNKKFNFKYDEFFTKRVGGSIVMEFIKKILGKRLTWYIWLQLKNIELSIYHKNHKQ